ncbi:MAG: hypothetical protein HYW10_03915 [Candidatus Omnitrophica bacterium]|nr:hypothetical protein [Candidatus Omnitrophota bacterium]
MNPKSKIQNPKSLLKVLQFGAQGLIPAVVQDAKTRQVLTLCYLNRAALKKSLETGTVHLFRRSQQRLAQKGETSGHIQVIREVRVDCEGKSLLLLVRQRVAACHAGYFTCYFSATRATSPATSDSSPHQDGSGRSAEERLTRRRCIDDGDPTIGSGVRAAHEARERHPGLWGALG